MKGSIYFLKIKLHQKEKESRVKDDFLEFVKPYVA